MNPAEKAVQEASNKFRRLMVKKGDSMEEDHEEDEFVESRRSQEDK